MNRDVPVSLDVLKFSQVIRNLLLNALQYTHRGGRVSVNVNFIRGGTQRISNTGNMSYRHTGGILSGADRVRIDVTDNGNGISEVSDYCVRGVLESTYNTALN